MQTTRLFVNTLYLNVDARGGQYIIDLSLSCGPNCFYLDISWGGNFPQSVNFPQQSTSENHLLQLSHCELCHILKTRVKFSRITYLAPPSWDLAPVWGSSS